MANESQFMICSQCGGKGFIGEPQPMDWESLALKAVRAPERCPNCDGKGQVLRPAAKITDYEPEVALFGQRLRQEWENETALYRGMVADWDMQASRVSARMVTLVIPNDQSVNILDWCANRDEVERIYIRYIREGITAQILLRRMDMVDDFTELVSKTANADKE